MLIVTIKLKALKENNPCFSLDCPKENYEHYSFYPFYLCISKNIINNRLQLRVFTRELFLSDDFLFSTKASKKFYDKGGEGRAILPVTVLEL
jgi:hypothetical protein